jgi:hypothetical protein
MKVPLLPSILLAVALKLFFIILAQNIIHIDYKFREAIT